METENGEKSISLNEFVNRHVNDLDSIINKVKQTPQGEIAETLQLFAISQQELAQKTIFDELTGVYNRRGLEVMLKKQIALAEREDTSFYVVMLDLDSFKEVNDKLGHIAGDSILQIFAELLVDNFREEDVITRFGGDEFAILVVDPNQKTEVIKDRCLEVDKVFKEYVRNDFDSSDKLTEEIGVSFGIVNWEKGMDAKSVIDMADKKMYEIKSLKKKQGNEQE